MVLAPALILASLVTQSLAPWVTGESRPEDLDVWCVTFSPGDMVNDWWGHTALVVQDHRLNHARLYNYGMFSVADPVAFVRAFIKGRLEFWVGEASVDGTFEFYKSLNRDVRVQELNLTPTQAQTVARLLGKNVLPENRNYLYHHYHDNCSTRPRDIIDQALGGQWLTASTGPARMSLRELTRLYSSVNPPMSLVLDYLQNDELEQPITQKDEAFLPDELERQLQTLMVTRPDGASVPAVKRQYNYFLAQSRPRPPATSPQWAGWLFILGLASGVTALGLAHWEHRKRTRLPRVLLGLQTMSLGLVWGPLGLVLLFMALFTDQTVTHRNENLFLINPVTFLILPSGAMLVFGSKKARTFLRWSWTVLAATAMFGVVLKLVPMFNQANWNLIALVLPVNVAMAAVWWLDYCHSKSP